MSRLFGLVGVSVLLCATACTYAGEGDELSSPDKGTGDWGFSIQPPADEEDDWDGFDEASNDDGPHTRCADGVKPRDVVAIDPSADPDTGQMRVRQGDRVVALPLAETSFDTIVLGMVADTEVRQVFENPFDEAIEAVYVFPLPHDAAVDDYAIEIGDRTIRGVMKTRADARAAYEKARDEGRSAGLLEQERPNIFTQSVANIPPGESITVVMHMVGPVTREQNHFELALPTVVGPRFVPGRPIGASGGGFAPDTDKVPDGSKITPKVLPDGYVSCAELSVHIEVDAGAPIDTLASKAHEVTVTEAGDRRLIELTRSGERLNRDFVLGWSLATKAPTTALMMGPKGDEGYFQLTIMPPRLAHAGEPVPRELVFVLDTSGSMSGEPMSTSKQAMHGFLNGMGPDDAFQVIRFSSDASALGPTPLPNNPTNLKAAHRHIDQLDSGGGTMMIEGIKAALDFPYTEGRARYVLFLTDGYIGNEMEIFQETEKRLDRARVFSLGVGSGPNRHLLDGLARAGRGAVTYVENHENPHEAVETFYRRLAHPVLTDLDIEWGDLGVQDVVPRRIPDLFAGQPVVVYGRMPNVKSGTATLVGYAGTERVEIPVRVDVTEARRTDGLASMWARKRIQELEDGRITEPDRGPQIEAAVTELALQHRVMSNYTSFVAIDDSAVANPDGAPARVDVPVDLVQGMDPAGVRLAGTTSASRSYSMSVAVEASASADMAPEADYDSGPVFKRAIGVRSPRRDPPDPEDVAEKKLQRRTRARRRRLRKCFDKDPARARNVRIVVTVRPNGKLENIEFDGSSADDDVEQCLQREVARWTITRPGGSAVRVEVFFDLDD